MQAGPANQNLFTAWCTRRFGAGDGFLPCTTNFRACSVRTDWDGTARASFGYCVTSMAVRARAVWRHWDHQTTGVALQWKS